MRTEVAFAIRDYTDLRLAQSQCTLLPMLTEASEPDRVALITIVSELGTNILKYAKHGYISLRRIEDSEAIDIEVVAEDDGPGMHSVALALQEHYSTGSTLGLGLPAVKRMADELHIDSAPGQGTRVAATKRIRGKPRRIAVPSRPLDASAPLASRLPCEVGECIRPMRSQPDCGDATVYIARGNSVLLGIADATGHGTAAGEVARLIRTTLLAQPDLSDLKASFEALHQTLKLSVGAACALLHVDLPSGMARYMGVGNTSALRVRGEHWRPVSRDGVLGQRLPTLYEQVLALHHGDVLVMWTDGVAESGLQEHVRHLTDKPAHEIAHDLVRSAGRSYDDAGVLVLKWSGA